MNYSTFKQKPYWLQRLLLVISILVVSLTSRAFTPPDSIPSISSYGNLYIGAGGQMFVKGPFNLLHRGHGLFPGIIQTNRSDRPGVLSFSYDIQPSGMSDSTYVDGYVRSYGARDQFVFPVGSTGRLRPCIAYPAGSFSGGVTAAFTDSLPPSWLGVSTTGIEAGSFWHIQGQDSVFIGLVLGAEELVQYQQDSTRLHLLAWQNDRWTDIPAHFEQVNPNLLGSSSATNWVVLKTNTTLTPDDYGVFALGSVVSDNPCPDITAMLSSSPNPVCAGGEAAFRVDIAGGEPPYALTYRVGGRDSTILQYPPGAWIYFPAVQADSVALLSARDVNGCVADIPNPGLRIPVYSLEAPLTISAATVCSGAGVTISATRPTYPEPLSFQWYQSLDSVVWAPISGAASVQLAVQATAYGDYVLPAANERIGLRSVLPVHRAHGYRSATGGYHQARFVALRRGHGILVRRRIRGSVFVVGVSVEVEYQQYDLYQYCACGGRYPVVCTYDGRYPILSAGCQYRTSGVSGI